MVWLKRAKVRWRVWSTEQSIEKEEPSIAAIVETFLATISYLWLASNFGFLLPLVFGLIAAPFVLLRTSYSVQAGIVMERRFERLLDRNVWFFVLLAIGLPCSFFVGWLLELSTYWYLFVVSFSPIIVSLIIVSLLIRTLATLRFLGAGLRALPSNFRKLWMCTSPSHVPEFVPGLNQTNAEIKLENPFTNPSFSSRPTYRKVLIIGDMIVFFIVLFPSWIFRWTVKSAFWFWWPISFMGSDLRLQTKHDLLQWNVVGSLKSKATILTSCAVLLAFFATNFLLPRAWLEPNSFISPLGYLFSFTAPLPWQIPALAAAGLSIVLVLLINDAEGKRQIAETTDDVELAFHAMRLSAWVERLDRVRLIASGAFWILALVQAVDYFNNARCIVQTPTGLSNLLEKVYSKRFHHTSCQDYSLKHIFTDVDRMPQ